MLYRSTARSRAWKPGGPGLLWLASVAVAVASGAAAAVGGALSAAAAAGVIGLLALALAPSVLAIAGVLILRGLSDAAADVTVVAGLNAGSLIGLLLIAGAALLVARRTLEARVRGVTAAVLISAALAFWVLVGVLQYGAHESLTREFVRAASVVAVGLIAVNADISLTRQRLSDVVVVAALIPAVLVLAEGVLQWQAVVGGDLRPRATLSHPNAAAILFGAAVPLAGWRWAYGGGGVRYLLAAGVLIAAILVTRSMGGIAQVVVALFVATMLLPGRGSARAILGLAALLVVGSFVFDPFGLSRINELETTGAVTAGVADADQPPNSFDWRLRNWSYLLAEWEEQPWLGHGLGATDEIVTPLGHLPHSDPVRALVEGGALGAAALFAAVAWVAARLLRRSSRGRLPERSFDGAVLAMLGGVGVHALVTHVSYNTLPLYVIVVVVAWTLAQPAAGERVTARG